MNVPINYLAVVVAAIANLRLKEMKVSVVTAIPGN